ncbi:hypothetical protein J6590_036120 [Homalodisca vitripennis]|nr:hypothetical protein J6590_036120 [Homalodisca vitripennis]
MSVLSTIGRGEVKVQGWDRLAPLILHGRKRKPVNYRDNASITSISTAFAAIGNWEWQTGRNRWFIHDIDTEKLTRHEVEAACKSSIVAHFIHDHTSFYIPRQTIQNCGALPSHRLQ